MAQRIDRQRRGTGAQRDDARGLQQLRRLVQSSLAVADRRQVGEQRRIVVRLGLSGAERATEQPVGIVDAPVEETDPGDRVEHRRRGDDPAISEQRLHLVDQLAGSFAHLRVVLARPRVLVEHGEQQDRLVEHPCASQSLLEQLPICRTGTTVARVQGERHVVLGSPVRRTGPVQQPDAVVNRVLGFR